MVKTKTSLEIFAGHPITQVVATWVAASVGTPLAALLPVLASSLAAERQTARVQDSLQSIEQVLQENSEKIKNFSDEQYKLVNEVVLAIFQTTDVKKLEYLRACVQGVISQNDLKPHEAVLLSRLIRDISAEEVFYLQHIFSFDSICFIRGGVGQGAGENVGFVDLESAEASLAQGLIALGVLVPSENTIDAFGCYRFSKITAKLIALLRG